MEIIRKSCVRMVEIQDGYVRSDSGTDTRIRLSRIIQHVAKKSMHSFMVGTSPVDLTALYALVKFIVIQASLRLQEMVDTCLVDRLQSTVTIHTARPWRRLISQCVSSYHLHKLVMWFRVAHAMAIYDDFPLE